MWLCICLHVYIYVKIYQSTRPVELLSHVQLFATPRTATHQASLSITKSQSLLKLMSIKLMMPSNHLILCHPLLFLHSIFPSIGVFSNESVLHIKWAKYWSFSFNIITFPMNSQDWFPLGWTGWISYCPRASQESSPTPQFKSINYSLLVIILMTEL